MMKLYPNLESERARWRGRKAPNQFPIEKCDHSRSIPTPNSEMEMDQFNNGELEDGQWKLYEAYNELHGLAQEFSTPFDAPAVLLVGHQTDGKSALVEALMGFQFNHVGGGTKTRRPITLHMKFNPDCHTPLCRLLSDSDPSIPQDKSLQQIQVLFNSAS